MDEWDTTLFNNQLHIEWDTTLFNNQLHIEWYRRPDNMVGKGENTGEKSLSVGYITVN